MSLSEHEKQQIQLIDSQVLQLQDKDASDFAILDALMDFVPDVNCIIDALEPEEVRGLFSKYSGFSHFSSIIEQAD